MCYSHKCSHITEIAEDLSKQMLASRRNMVMGQER